MENHICTSLREFILTKMNNNTHYTTISRAVIQLLPSLIIIKITFIHKFIILWYYTLEDYKIQ